LWTRRIVRDLIRLQFDVEMTPLARLLR
jgi:hypothetical protein